MNGWKEIMTEMFVYVIVWLPETV